MFALLFTLAFYLPQDSFTVHTAKPSDIKFFYAQKGERIGHLEKLQKIDPSLTFAMNGQMFAAGTYAPLGLYVENGKVIHKVSLFESSNVNFGITPTIFYITKKGEAGFTTPKNANPSSYSYATQLAPRLLTEGKINPRLQNMKRKTVRNGIGILPDGRILFLVSNSRITMTEFAGEFLKRGCRNAAYVDGAVSEYWKRGQVDTYGEFGVMVAAR